VVSRLHAIVDVDASARAGRAPLDIAHAFLDGGARVIQLRAKPQSSSAFLSLADDCVRLAAPYGAAVIVNDRLDIARLSAAAGAHVGQDDVTPAAARRLLGDGAVVGVSTHTVPQMSAALAEPISYLAVGPVFGTSSKETGYTAVGLALVATASQMAGTVPVVAIGGITLDNAASVIAAGASSVAIIGDLLVGGDPARRTRALLQSLGDNRV
jgi:thiamine-phosphate pyrophosphorylase